MLNWLMTELFPFHRIQTFPQRKKGNSRSVHISGLNFHKCIVHFSSSSGLEKSSVLQVLDRFLNHKTDFVLNRTQKNRSIKIRVFFRPVLNNSL